MNDLPSTPTQKEHLMTKTVLILGASGRIGRHSAKAFEEAGWHVRRFDRKRGDMLADAEGADLIVHGLNPPNYHAWGTLVPEITEQVIVAASASGATVLLPGNVYHFGDQPGIWSERTPPRPVSRKGDIRLAMERRYEESGVQTIVLRAGNFIDPDRQGCIMSEIYLRAIEKGRITVPGPENTRQAMCYLPDWARAAVSLAERREDLGGFEDIPFPGHTLSAAGIRSGLERLLEKNLTYARFPWWLFSLTAPVWELARELKEMRYLWSTDHALCDRRFRELLPDFQATDLDTVLRAALPEGLKSGFEEGLGTGADKLAGCPA
jgi:nucleoside-diphosphate-sugar epimerase